MVFNILFLILVLILIISRAKGYCNDCEGSKIEDIFQILVVGIIIIFWIGVIPILKLILVILLSCIGKFLLRKKSNKNNSEKKSQCSNCEDNFF